MVQAGPAQKCLWSYCLWDQLSADEEGSSWMRAAGTCLSGEHSEGKSACISEALMKCNPVAS